MNINDINKDFPIINWDFDEEDMEMGMMTNSLVPDPAIEIDYLKFSKDKEVVKASFKTDKMKRIITGPVCLADTLIYRNSPTMGEYYGKFSADTIEKMMIKYTLDGNTHKMNELHTSNKQVRDIYMIESYIVGDKVTSELFNVPKGSWIASYFVKSEEFWDEYIMSDKFKGFSLEGSFFEIYENMKSDQFIKELDILTNKNLEQTEFKIKAQNLYNKYYK